MENPSQESLAEASQSAGEASHVNSSKATAPKLKQGQNNSRTDPSISFLDRPCGPPWPDLRSHGELDDLPPTMLVDGQKVLPHRFDVNFTIPFGCKMNPSGICSADVGIADMSGYIYTFKKDMDLTDLHALERYYTVNFPLFRRIMVAFYICGSPVDAAVHRDLLRAMERVSLLVRPTVELGIAHEYDDEDLLMGAAEGICFEDVAAGVLFSLIGPRKLESEAWYDLDNEWQLGNSFRTFYFQREHEERHEQSSRRERGSTSSSRPRSPSAQPSAQPLASSSRLRPKTKGPKRKRSSSTAGEGGLSGSTWTKEVVHDKPAPDDGEMKIHHFEARFHIPFSSERVKKFNPNHIRMADIAIVDIEGEKHDIEANVTLQEQQDLVMYLKNLPGPRRVLVAFEYSRSFLYPSTQSDVLDAMRTLLPLAICGFHIGFDWSERGTIGLNLPRMDCDRLLAGFFSSITLGKGLGMTIHEDEANDWKQDIGPGGARFEWFHFDYCSDVESNDSDDAQADEETSASAAENEKENE